MRRVRLGQARFSVTVEILEASWPPREAGERLTTCLGPSASLIHLTDAAQRWNSKCARVHKVPEKCVESARNASTRGGSGDDRPSIPPSPFLPRTCARTILFKRDEKNRCRVAARLNSRRVETRATPCVRHRRPLSRSFLSSNSLSIHFDRARSKSIFTPDSDFFARRIQRKLYFDRPDCPGIGTDRFEIV